MSLISAQKLIFEYVRRDKNGDVDGFSRAIDDVNLDIWYDYTLLRPFSFNF